MYTLKVMSGSIADLDWDGESKKISICGDGGASFHVKVLTYDTGNQVSECIGLTKKATTVAYRQQRPFRVVAGGEDMKCVLYAGPPFKRECEAASHSNYVNCVRYSPDGDLCVSVGSDKKVVLYDGKTLEVKGEFCDVHKGSIYACAWSSDGSKLVTCSADKTVKLLEMPSGKVLSTCTIGDKLGSFVVGVAMSLGDIPIAVTLSGIIHVLDAGCTAVTSTIEGHQDAIMSHAVASNGDLYTSSSDGTVCCWKEGGRSCKRVSGGVDADVNGAVHSGKVSTVSSNSLFVQLSVRSTLCSFNSLFVQLSVRSTLCSFNSLFRKNRAPSFMSLPPFVHAASPLVTSAPFVHTKLT